MKQVFIGFIVISALAFSAALARTGDDETYDVELILSELPLTAGMQ